MILDRNKSVYNYDFTESLKLAKVLLTGHNTGVYNPEYKAHIFKKAISLGEGESIEDLKKRINRLAASSSARDSKFNTRVKPTDLATVIEMMRSGVYAQNVFTISKSTDPHIAKDFAMKIHSFNDKKWSDTYKYIKDDEIVTVTTNDATNKTNGFVFFDLDFPKEDTDDNYVNEEDKPQAVTELKQLIYDNLKQYNWFVLACKSTSGNGVHVYTYNLIPESFSESERILYWQNCYQIMEQCLIEAITPQKERLLDHCSTSPAQGVNITITDNDPFVNENFRLRPNMEALKLAVSHTAYCDTPQAKYIKTKFLKKRESSPQQQIIPTYNIDGMPCLDEAPYRFRHGKWNDGIPPLGVMICFFLYYYGLERTIEFGKLGIYKSSKRTLSESAEHWIGYANSMYGKEIEQPSPYVIEWARQHLKLNIDVDFNNNVSCTDKQLTDEEYASKYMLDDLEAISSSKEYKTVKIIVAPGGGKTEAAKSYAKKHNVDIIIPYNPVITNKFQDIYQVSSMSKNDYDPSQSCVMIPDQWIKHYDDIDGKDMVIIDEIHQLWQDQSYRSSCEKFLEQVTEKYNKVILLTGTPMGEDISITPDLTISYMKPQPPHPMDWVTVSKNTRGAIQDLITEAIERSDFVGIYANRYFSRVEEITRMMTSLNLCKPFLYACSGYKDTQEMETFLKTKMITDKYQGIVYTKYLGVGHDILDEGNAAFLFIKSDHETGGDIHQAAARFRKAKIHLRIVEVEHTNDIYKNTEELVEYVNNQEEGTLERVVGQAMLYSDKTVSVNDNQYAVNQNALKNRDSISDYGNNYSHKSVIISYLIKHGFVYNDLRQYTTVSGEDGPKMKAAFRDEDHDFICENIATMFRLYKERRINSKNFDDFMQLALADEDDRIENNVFYLHNRNYALSILRKLWVLDTLEIRNLDEIEALTDMKPEALKNLIIFVNWSRKLKELPKEQLARLFELDEKDFQTNFLRKVLKIDPTENKDKKDTLKFKKLQALYRKYKTIVDQIYFVFRLYEIDITADQLDDATMIEMLIKQKDLLKKEKKIKIRKSKGTRVINLETKTFYNSINECCETEKIQKDKLMQLAAQGKYKIEPKKSNNGKQLINVETKEIYNSVLDAVQKLKLSKYKINKLIKEKKLMPYEEKD